MSTLLLRFAAPLQSWGSGSKFTRRMTEREPTKSGIVGFLAAALGIRRTEDDEVQRLANSLKFGVRVDQPGQFLRDYHTASNPDNEKLKFITHRYYLADAVFLVGLEGDEALLKTLDAAVRSPMFPLFLGRRSCPPVGRVSLGIRGKKLRDALTEEPWQAGTRHRRREEKTVRLTLVCDAEAPNAPLRRQDVPLSFSQAHRKYASRGVEDIPEAVSVDNPDGRQRNATGLLSATEHDPFTELEDNVNVPVEN